MKNVLRYVIILGVTLVLSSPFSFPCSENEPIGRIERLLVLYDYALDKPMQRLFLEFNRTHDNLQVVGKALGSREIAYILREGIEKPDLIFLADPEIFNDLLIPEYIDWYISFGKDEIVLAFTNESKYSEQINKDNWCVLLQDVCLARPDENLSCLGYRTLMVWYLAQKYYNLSSLYSKLEEASQRCVYQSEEDVINLLKSGDIDYTFTYLSIAKQRGLRYIPLPAEINLRDKMLDSYYMSAKVRLTGKNRLEFVDVYARSIQYCFSIPKNIPIKEQRRPYIQEFLKLFFSQKGEDILGGYMGDRGEVFLYDLKEVPLWIKEICRSQ